jgi:hypothetical protein
LNSYLEKPESRFIASIFPIPGELFKHQHTYVVIGARHRIALPTSVLTRKEFLESFQKPNCWLLSNIRDLSESNE